MPAAYEVRITPLLRGVPTLLETDGGGVTRVDEADTTLVTEYLDDGFEVNIAINDSLTAQVVIPIDEPVVAGLEPFAQAVWIGYRRPGAAIVEGLIYGACNVITDYGAGTVTLVIQDPTLRCQHHYVRRGDAALNAGPEKGVLRTNFAGVDTLIDAARNTQEQQDRHVPALAFTAWHYGALDTAAPPFGLERGQEVWDLVDTQILKADSGADAYIAPIDAWTFPFGFYAELGLYDRYTDPATPGPNELGRNLDPADPDAPATGEVIFDLGQGLDNLIGLVETPDRPTTHCHVVDEDRRYRVTAADAASSADVGVYVDWIDSGIKIVSDPTTGILRIDILQAIADARVKGWGRPPKHFTCTLRPDDAQPYHYGHKFFADFTGADTVGDFQIGDFVRVRATRGYRSFSVLARITGVTFRLDQGLPVLDVRMIPAVTGSAGEDPQGN